MQDRVFVPDTSMIEASNPDKRFAFMRKDQIDAMKMLGWEVYSDIKKEAQTLSGQLPLDTTIQTFDLVYMFIGGVSKDKWENRRKERNNAQQEEIKARHKALSDTNQFHGKIDVR